MNVPKFDKVLVICGPTGTGKTNLGLELARQFRGDLISADSRQVFQGLDVVTGKDIPEDFRSERVKIPNWGPTKIYTNGEIKLWGLDLLTPSQTWSAGSFKRFATAAINFIHSKRRLPIIVGGTGLYLKSLVENLPLAKPGSVEQRSRLEKLTLEQLQEQLRRQYPTRYFSLNQSDLGNPRRLIRALEVGVHPPRGITKSHFIFLMVGLFCPPTKLESRIKNRVKARLGPKLDAELAYLEQLPEVSEAAITAIGYELLKTHQSQTQQQLIDLWTSREVQYAKRQMTWFKKQTGVEWFDISQKAWQDQLVERVTSWYH